MYSDLSHLFSYAVGIISRADADELLHNKPLGSYLIRVSVKIWGYTVSVKCELMEKCMYRRYLTYGYPATRVRRQ